jgi:hypothetical protein
MKEKYKEWVKEYLDRTPFLLGKCIDASKEMREVFPELREKKGYVQTLVWGEREHVWMVDEEGNIIDPTVGQFPHGALSYREWVPGALTRVGRCMECGEHIWRCVDSLDSEKESACSPECEELLREMYKR